MSLFPVVILPESACFAISLSHFDLSELIDRWMIQQYLGGSLLDGAADAAISEAVTELRGRFAPVEVYMGLGGGSGGGAIDVLGRDETILFLF